MHTTANTTTTANINATFGGQMSSKFIAQMSSKNYRRWQMSSYHCRHCRNWADVLQTLPPKQMSSNATTTARISRIQNLITNDGFTYIQPLLLRAAGSLREFPSCFHDPSPTNESGVCTASLSHLRTMLPKSSSCPKPAQRLNH